MGSSIPKKKLKEIVCTSCDIKCKSYLEKGTPGYAPLASHKVHRGTDPEEMFVYCTHYNYISYIQKMTMKGIHNL